MGIITEMDWEFDEEVRFIITKWTSHITDSGEDETINKKPEGLDHKFRLLDDDDTIYAYGYADSDSTFVPMDYYEGRYGVTAIQFKNPETGEYEYL